MTDAAADLLIRRAIGGDREALVWICRQAAPTSDPVGDPTVLATAALLACPGGAGDLLDRADSVASSREDRQLVAIARAHLAGRRELVDALARDHLVDFPGSYVVAWVASGGEIALPR